MTGRENHKRILALDVHPRSIGFVVFEGANDLLDWGVKELSSRMAASKIRALLDESVPAVIAIANRRAKRPRGNAAMLSEITKHAKAGGIPVRLMSHEEVNGAFVGFEANKDEIAAALAKQFPVLASRLPPKRKCWNGEDYRMGIFDAAAAGVAYFTNENYGQPIDEQPKMTSK